MLGINNEFPVSAVNTIDDYVKVFPDACKHLETLRRIFHSTNLRKLLAKLKYKELNLSPAELSMDLCFVGQMHSLSLEDLKKVKKRHLKRAMKEHAQKHYEGHPLHIFKSAITFANVDFGVGMRA